MTRLCVYPNCDCAVSFPDWHLPSDDTECPRVYTPATALTLATASAPTLAPDGYLVSFPGQEDVPMLIMKKSTVNDLRRQYPELIIKPFQFIGVIDEPFAYCCSSFDVAVCDCVNKNHGTARRG